MEEIIHNVVQKEREETIQGLRELVIYPFMFCHSFFDLFQLFFDLFYFLI